MELTRILPLATVLGFLFVSSLSAQRGAGHAGIAGPGFAPGAQRSTPAGSFRAGRSSGPNLGGQPYPIRTDIPTPIGLNAPAASYTGILPGAFKSSNNYGGRGGRFAPGFGGFPLFIPPYVDLGFTSSTGYDAPIPVDPNAQALAESQEALAQQIQQLTAEVQQMRNGSGQQQQQPTPAPAVSAVPERRPPTPPITLILRDGQQLSIQNYAIMNQTFWNFSKYPVQKIPVANIDLAASAKATEANGGEFPQIGSGQ